MKAENSSILGGAMKRAVVEKHEVTVGGKPCPQFFIFDVGIDGNGSRAQVASGTLISGQAGPGSPSTGFLSEFSSPEAWARAFGRVLVRS